MTLEAAIEKARRDLLDLTARNRLVHTPLDGKRNSWIPIRDERTDALFDILVRKGKAMSFLSIPEEEVEEDREQFVKFFEGEDDSESDELSDRHTDLFLQTPYKKDPLHKKLLRCFLDARTVEEEQGVSVLYLACGFLKWRESQNSEIYRYAPLLLIPVDLTRNNAKSQFRVSFRDEDILTNLSIQARLREDFGFRLPDIPEAAQDDDDWSPTKYFDEVRKLIKDREGWEILDNKILLWFFSFTKFLMYQDLKPEKWLTENELVTGLLSHGFQSSVPPLCDEHQPLDDVLNPAHVIHVTDADSSQAVVIQEIVNGRNLVVQGPPGTGKSQTITNAIAAAVHAGKRVLFVSEKMAALEVVKRRLDTMGLGPMILELHSHQARKREVLENLRSTLEGGVPQGKMHVDKDELSRIVGRLRAHDRTLHSIVGNIGRTPYQAIGRLLDLRSEGLRPLNDEFHQTTDWTSQQYQEMLDAAIETDRLLESSGVPEENPWYGIQCRPLTPADQDRLTDKLKTVLSGVQKLIQSNTELAKYLGQTEADSLLATSNAARLAAHVRKCPARKRFNLTNAKWTTHFSKIDEIVQDVFRLHEQRKQVENRVSDIAWETDLSNTRIALAAHGKSWFRFFNAKYREAVAHLRGLCVEEPPTNADERVALVDTIISVQKITRQLASNQNWLRELLGDGWDGDESISEVIATLSWVKEADKSRTLRGSRQISAQVEDLNVLAEPIRTISQTLKQVDEGLRDLIESLDLNPAAVFDQSEPRKVPLASWEQAIKRWLGHPEQLSHYLATSARLNSLREAGLKPLADDIERGKITSGVVAKYLELITCEAVIKRAWQERPELAEFHGDTFEQLRSRFAELDQQRIALSRLDVAAAHHKQLPTMAESGQVGVIKREINKKRRHMPIRKLIKNAGHAIQKIKPVFMMSPLSVAQFLEPESVEFDLLVIDEASQVRPVDALGAIARCRQIAVVGDQKQLPPTDFFSRMASGDSDDDESGEFHAGDVESILGLCEAQGLPSRMLSWHYRSQHESLIAVSNRQFYDDRLFIVPSPIFSGGALGLKLRYIADGWYDRGGSRTNRVEAKAVVAAILNHARNFPDDSLGVATFSNAQRDAIIDELELQRRNNPDPQVEEFLIRGGAEPFFVKSLENVQGDQRDVMLISIGYARDQTGYFAQSFGPLNRKGGERRLNVLISRAARACEVFTSLKADDIDLNRTQSEGVVALKVYLTYAEHGYLEAPQSLGDADSVFEEQVAQTLRNNGLEIDHQVGVGGFKIDLAVRDPSRSGRYLLGIECDGAQYHSARWVRDRDRLRQQVLESRGWSIHRIWSTDWFQRPEEQLRSVLNAVEEAKSYWRRVDEQEGSLARNFRPQTTIQSVDEDSFWERIEVESSEQQEDKNQHGYRQASFSIRDHDGTPSDLSVRELAVIIKKVVEIEAPIHLEEIGRRLIDILSQGRLTSKLKDAIGTAVSYLQDHGIKRRGDFVYLVSQADYPVRDRSSVDNVRLRRVELIPPEEIRTAIIKVVTDYIGTDEQETASSVAKLLGISNTRTLQNAVQKQIRQLTADETIDDRAGKLFVL